MVLERRILVVRSHFMAVRHDAPWLALQQRFDTKYTSLALRIIETICIDREVDITVESFCWSESFRLYLTQTQVISSSRDSSTFPSTSSLLAISLLAGTLSISGYQTLPSRWD